ncbi:PHD finger protein 13 isoform X2 [Bombina bombina]|nr:PHD finger protein 13 isoform X2 [Bombina bombina]
MMASASPLNSTGSTVDSDSCDSRYHDLSTGVLPIKKRKGFVDLKNERSFPTMLKCSKVSNFLLDRKKMDKIKRKKKLKKKGQESLKQEYLQALIKLEPEDSFSEPSTPVEHLPLDIKISPQFPPDVLQTSMLEGSNNSMDSDSVMTSDDRDEKNTEYTTINLGKRTVIRQGKQVVFRDEDSTGNDEDIMVDSDDDSWNLVTCFCMKPFAGRPMIECNECNTWIHLSCAKIRKSNVPEIYICQKCRDTKFDIRRSNRSRMGCRKLFLD